MSKKIIKEIINYVRTIQIYHYISKYNNIHSKLAYSNNVQKKEITLLCNGPSLKEVLPAVSKMSNQDFVVVNFFAFSEFFKQIKPRIYCLCDGMFFLNTPKNKRREEVLKLYKILNEDKALGSLYFLKNIMEELLAVIKISAFRITPCRKSCNIFYVSGNMAILRKFLIKRGLSSCWECGSFWKCFQKHPGFLPGKISQLLICHKQVKNSSKYRKNTNEKHPDHFICWFF